MSKLPIRPRRNLELKAKKNIALMRFGSLDNFDRVYHSMKEIAKHLNINYQTVASFLHRVRDHGPRAIGDCWHKPKPRPIGNADVEALLLSDVLLTKWAALTMRERALKVKSRFNVDVDHHRLRAFYRRNQIRYRKTYQCFQGSYSTRGS